MMCMRRASSCALAVTVLVVPCALRAQEADEGAAAARFAIDGALGRPGETLDVPFGVETAGALSMVSWSFEYDPRTVAFIEPVLSIPLRQIPGESPGSDVLFTWHVEPDIGWVQIDLVVDFAGRPDASVPPGLALQLATLRFEVLLDAGPGRYPIRFTRPETAPSPGVFLGEDGPVYNVVRFAGAPIDPGERFRGAENPELDDGAISVAPIIGDVGIFVRGDANLDFSIDISDPVAIVDGLFLDGGKFLCPAAADADGDAEIDIGDPITILNYLFIGTGDWAPTSEHVGETDGALPCDELYEPTEPDGSP